MGGGIKRSGRGDRGRTSVVGSGVNAVEWDECSGEWCECGGVGGGKGEICCDGC